MQFFRPVELPADCYLQEAALWVALGRLPEREESENGEEWRRNQGAEDVGTIELYNWLYPGFLESEFRSHGVDIDYERYARAKNKSHRFTGGQWRERARERYDRAVAMGASPRALESHLRWLNKADEEACDADWAFEMERVFEPAMDLARAKVFEAVATGDLRSWGFLKEGIEETQEDGYTFREHLFRRVEIPKERWTLRRFEWMTSQLAYGDDTYYGVNIRCSDLISKFPKPNVEPKDVAGRYYPELLVVDDVEYEPVRSSRRGRPRKQVSLERVIRTEFNRRLQDGVLPEKLEAVYADADEFAQTIGAELSRTTAQRALKPILDRLPKKNARK